MLGDICYIVVAPGDGADFCVSATTEGYFINKVSDTFSENGKLCLVPNLRFDCIMYHLNGFLLNFYLG